MSHVIQVGNVVVCVCVHLYVARAPQSHAAAAVHNRTGPFARVPASCLPQPADARARHGDANDQKTNMFSFYSTECTVVTGQPDPFENNGAFMLPEALRPTWNLPQASAWVCVPGKLRLHQ